MADTGFLRPSLATIDERVKADINARLTGADARLRRSFLNVIGRVMSGLAHGLYGYQAWIARQAIVDTADTSGLDAWGSVFAVARKLATRATGNITVTGTTGTVIPSGTEFQRSDGVTFVSTASATLAGGTASVAVQSSGVGSASNTAPAAAINFISPIPNVNSYAVVATGGLVGGTDDELDEAYKARILARIQQPPHGGASADYEAWVYESIAATRVWVYPLENGAGTVVVRFMMDGTYSNGIPLSGDVTKVQTYIDNEYRRPVTADVTVAAPTPTALNVTISNLLADTAEVRAAIAAELADMVTRTSEPGGTIYVSNINEAISLATGETSHTLVSPSSNVTYGTGNIAVLGSITYS